MTASCEIVLEKLNDVLMVPVAAVVDQQGEYVCWVVTENGFERRPLVVGITGTSADATTSTVGAGDMVEAKDGVSEGELVVLNPRAMVPQAREVLESAGTSKTDQMLTQTPELPGSEQAAAADVEAAEPGQVPDSTNTEQ